MIPVEEPTLTGDRQTFLSEFTSLTEYGRSDILAFSTDTKIILTRNGGKYHLDDGKLTHLKGPSADPSERL
jgi:hypothetical protein